MSELRDIWKTLDRAGRKRFLRKTGTTEGYVEKLCGGHCCPSLEMAARMRAAEPRLTFEGFLSSRRRRLKANAKRSAGES